MASTFPTSRTNSNTIKDGLKEIQTKKEALILLETALKRRVCELRELCLKEGELTGQLPIDYPLQPREPIPQIRRRINHDNNSSSSTAKSILPQIGSINRNHHELGTVAASSSNPNLSSSSSFPARPMSTNSTSSSISTASSSQTRSNHMNNPTYLMNNNIGHCFNKNSSNITTTDHHFQNRNQTSHHFKRPFNAPIVSTFDSDSLGHVRASSTASSSSSSGSATSSTLSAPSAFSNMKLPPPHSTSSIINKIPLNIHQRSCSESVTSSNSNNNQMYLTNKTQRAESQNIMPRQLMMDGQQLVKTNGFMKSSSNCPPLRPPRGTTHSNHLGDYNNQQQQQQQQSQHNPATELNKSRPVSENRNNGNHFHKTPLDVSTVKPLQHFNTNGSFQPYYEEETKPFQMSDYLKYSSKYRQKISDSQKTTRQLQEENSRINQTNKLLTGDDKIEASMRKIERSGQKLLEATAKAIAGNPSLAEKINQILPCNNDLFHHHNHHQQHYHSEKVKE